MPAPLPDLLSVLTRLEGGDSLGAEQELASYLGVPLREAATWEEIPEAIRLRVDGLCRVSMVPWERPEHGLFRAALAGLKATGMVDLAPLHSAMRDRSLPEDRRFLAASLIAALVTLHHGQPVRHQAWALPRDCQAGTTSQHG